MLNRREFCGLLPGLSLKVEEHVRKCHFRGWPSEVEPVKADGKTIGYKVFQNGIPVETCCVNDPRLKL